MAHRVAHILCVDADRDWCQLLKTMLESAGQKRIITAASDLREARILVDHVPFDLYIFAGARDGAGAEAVIELSRKIRRNGSDAPVLIYSTAAGAINQQTVMAAGANLHLTVPDDLERLPDVVESVLSGTERRRSASVGAAHF